VSCRVGRFSSWSLLTDVLTAATQVDDTRPARHRGGTVLTPQCRDQAGLPAPDSVIDVVGRREKFSTGAVTSCVIWLWWRLGRQVGQQLVGTASGVGGQGCVHPGGDCGGL
jgi:hypothetical protein